MYNMKMKFALDIKLKGLPTLLDDLVLKNAQELTITQKLPIIPDDNYINEVCKAIKATDFEKFTVVHCRFIGYEYLKEC